MANKLCTLDICHIPVAIYEDSPKRDEALAGCYGYCSVDGQKIVVEEGLSPEQFRETLLHEIRHFIWAQSGIRYTIAAYWGEEPGSPRMVEFEEMFLRLETLHIIAVLKEMKKLKLK